MLTDTLVEVSIPSEFVELCNGWAGNTDCMLREVDSTGGLTLGMRRPYNRDVERVLTDQEWHLSLWNSLSCDLGYNARLAERMGHEDATELRRFETFADETIERLRAEYGLEDSEAV